jgi:hypothetical protein
VKAKPIVYRLPPEKFAGLAIGLFARYAKVLEHAVIKVFQKPALTNFFQLKPELTPPRTIEHCAHGTRKPRGYRDDLTMTWNFGGRTSFAAARHVSSPWRSETTLDCWAADRAAVDSPE